MNTRISDSAQLLPPERAAQILPDVATALILGASVVEKYKDGDGIYVGWNQFSEKQPCWHLSQQDFDVAKEVANTLNAQLFIEKVVDGTEVLRIRRHADRMVMEKLKEAILGDLYESGGSVAMLKDKGSSGWWRMVLPARVMEKKGWRFDCTAAPVDFDSLLEYDTIFVQRIHDWESYYMLERLKAAGKYIVYDIDDDLFNITPDNPAYNTITRDDQIAAAHCMKLADVVTTTTAELQRRLTGVLDGVSPIVVPNAWQTDDNWSEEFGSPDEYKRILWTGGASHAADWEVCFDAVCGVMEERPEVRLMILGYLPPCIENNIDMFKDRIEFCGFRDPETYYNLIHHVRADVGLAPIQRTGFNAAKCLVGGTRVATGGGIVRIRDVGEGMKVWRDGAFRQVTASVKYENVPTVKITTRRGYGIEGTPHHRMRRGGSEFVKLEDFKKEDEIELSFFEFPETTYQKLSCPLFWTKKLDGLDFDKIDEKLAPSVEVEERWGRFLGYLLGDGHMGALNDVRISCDKQDDDVVCDIEDFACRIGLSPKRKEKKRADGYSGRGVEVSIPSRSLRWFLAEKCGFVGRYGKKLGVPDVIWRSPKSVVREFLRGLFEADGTVGKGSCSFTTKEYELAQEVMFLLLGFGILTKLKTYWHKQYKKNYYTVTLQRQACDVFEKEVGFFSERKRKKLAEITSKPHSNAFKEWSMSDLAAAVETGREDVYDLQVPDGESYMANGMVSHNSSIKYLEYSLIGVPTVASDWLPYNAVITDKVNGRLVETHEDWKKAIEYLLDRPNKGKEMVMAARRNCQQFDLNKVANEWAYLLCRD